MEIPTLRQIASAKFAETVCDLEDEDDCRNLVETLLTFPPAYLKRVIPEMPFNGLKCLMQSGQFDNYLTSDAMNESVQREENRLRQLYAKRPDHKSVRSLTAGLVDIFGTTPFNNTNADLFKLRKWGKDFFESGRTSDSKADEDASNGDTEDVPEARETKSMNTNKDTKVEIQEGETKESVVSKKKSTNKRPKRMIMFAEGNIPSVASTGSPSIVSSLSEFRKNFNCFTSNALLGMDWTNVLAAGGACTACLLPLPPETNRGSWFDPELPWHTKSWESNARQEIGDSTIKRLYNEEEIIKFGKRSRSHKSRDIDLFLYGLDAEQAKAKIQEIHQAILDVSRRPPFVVINGHAVTFYREFPNRSIQVITRLYKSPSEVLLGFDVDSCCVGFDGERVLCAPRTVRAFNTRCNIVDMSRRSLSYESRLFKYAKREFACIVPDIERNEINPQMFDVMSMSNVPFSYTGLQKLLMHELSFRDFREPECKCLQMMRALKEEGDDGLDRQYGPYLYDQRSHCFQKKCQNACKDPSEGIGFGQPVTLRDLQIHHRKTTYSSYQHGGTKSGRENLYQMTGPSFADENNELASKMRGLKKLTPVPTKDYEYITLPWKKGISMEQCHATVSRIVNKHHSEVEWRSDYMQENEENGDFWDEWGPVDPNAPMCVFGFDVKKNLHHIKWVKCDAGRQLLTGSFHPVDDANWYDGVRLAIGVHKRFQIVLEKIDYPANVPSAAKLASSMIIRQAVVECYPKPEDVKWILGNKSSWANGALFDIPPTWWQGKIALVSAATLEQVEHFKLALAVASPSPFEKITFNEYDIVVGEKTTSKVSLALAMAQPALNRCDYCSSELLVPNRCRGCKKVSFCNKKCQQQGWPKHRNVCAAGKKRKKKKKQPESRSTKA